MSRLRLAALNRRLAERSLAVFLPISGAITLVLVPMVWLYEQSRHEIVRERAAALLEAGRVRVQVTLREVRANTGVLTAMPAIQDLMAAPQPAPLLRRRVEAVLRSQLKEYERFLGLAVYSEGGLPLAELSRKPSLVSAQDRRRALNAGATIEAGELWLSPVQWIREAGSPPGAELLASRPLFSGDGQRRGVLLVEVTLSALARDFDRIANSSLAQYQGYLLSGDGRIVNSPPGATAGQSFAAHYPQVWHQMQRQSRGAVTGAEGLFVYQADRLLDPLTLSRAQRLPLSDSALSQHHLVVVIRVPPHALHNGSLFGQPLGRGLVLLLYLLVGVASVGIGASQQGLEQAREHERRLQERLQTVVRSAGVGMYLCDAQTGRFLSANDALCRFFGRSEADLQQCTWQELTHPDDLAADQRLAEQLLRGEVESYRMRKRFLRPEGSSVWGDLVVACTRHDDGTVRDLIGQIADVSELVAKSDDLEAAAGAGIVGVWDWNVRENRIRWDSSMVQLYGLQQPGPAITVEWWERTLHPDDRAAVMQSLHAALEGIGPFDCQFRVEWPDGSVHDLRARGRVQFDRDGKPERMIGVNYEVTELVRKSTYLEAAASAGIIGVWDWDVARDVLTWDPVMHRLYGLRAEECRVSREAWESAVHPDDRPMVLQALDAALRGWRDYQPRFRVVWPDGSIHHLQARSQTTYGRGGEPLRMIGVNYDITEQVERELEVEQQRLLLATTIDALQDPLLLLSLQEADPGVHRWEPRLVISELNHAAAAFFRRNRPQLLGNPLTHVLSAALNPALHASLLAVARGGPSFLVDDQAVQVLEGADPLHLDLRAVAVSHGLVLSFRDVSERRRAAIQLAASEERFRLLAENVTDVVFLSEEERITWVAHGLTAALGWTTEQWLQHSLADFCHPDDLSHLHGASERVERGRRQIFRVRLLDSSQCWHWVEVHAGPNRAPDGSQSGAVSSFRIVDDEVEAEASLRHRACTDPLTGLFNRQEIFERLERLAQHRRHVDGALAVLFCDIDNFKQINDRHGHGGGDAVLKALAQRLQYSTRRGDLVGRIGGDELLVVLPAMPSLEAAVALAEKVHAAAAEPLMLPTGELIPTLSIGVSLIHPDERIAEVVARADAAMYEAKTRGRNRVMALS